jgi:hypothetical protein
MICAQNARTTAPLTMEEWNVKASSAKVRNDTDWIDPESSKRLNDLESVAHGQFLDKFKVKDGLDQILQDVRPFFERDPNMKTKKSIFAGDKETP